MKKYDLHIHTHYSKCSNLKPKTILKVAKKIGLDGIAITDHDSTKGAFLVHKLNKCKDFEVIIGQEVTTDVGHILAYYLQEHVRSKKFYNVIDEIKSQGAVSSIAHPFTVFRKKYRLNVYNTDAIECFNSRNVFLFSNTKAKEIAKKFTIAQTAGSDAHFKFEVGRGLTIFNNDLIKAIKKRKTCVTGTNYFAIPGGMLSFFKSKLQKFI